MNDARATSLVFICLGFVTVSYFNGGQTIQSATSF